MNNFARWTGVALVTSMLGLPLSANADVSVDLTQGVPGYMSVDGVWTTGIVPEGYQRTASTNQLIITALPGLTAAQSELSNLHNDFWLGGLTGDFSATVTSVVTGKGGGGFGVANDSSKTWAGFGFTVDQISPSYGLLSGANVNLPSIAYQGAPVSLNLARMSTPTEI